VLIAWLLAAVGAISLPQHAGADGGDLASRARAILSYRCFQCHGANGAARKNIFVLDRARLVSSRTVIPGQPSSPLLEAVESGAMPSGGPELSVEEKAALRDWVMAGAPDWKGDAATGEFIAEPSILALILDDLMKASHRARPYLRYFSFAHLYNSGASDQELQTYRVALAKLVNSLSWHREITPPAAIDSARTLFRIDLRDYNWTDAIWNRVLAAYPYAVLTRDGEMINRLSGASLPYVRADWFVARASLPPLYHEMLGLPASVQELEKMLSLDTARNLEEEKSVARAGIRASGVSQNNRVLERHTSAHGAYWKSFDYRSNLDEENIFKDPVRLRPAGGEIIFSLPNGLQAYFLADGNGRRIDAAPIQIVADRNNADDPVIRNGRSCMSCHYEGIKSFKDEVRAVVAGSTAGFFDREKALALYPPQDALDRSIEEDRDRFRKAMDRVGNGATVNALSEPVGSLARRFIAELSIAQAAAEAGLDVREFQARVRRSGRLISAGFGQMLVEGGGIKRDTWDRHFGDMARELRLGDSAPDNLLLSAGKNVSSNFSGAPARSRIRGIDPIEIMRAARTLFVWSSTVFLKPEQLENELRKRPEFRELGLVIVKDPNVADIRVDLGRPLFTYTFTFSVTDPETSILVTSGKVTAFDGNFAAPKIAKELLKRFHGARGAN
jgi:mono/diheme cytochrome c family protein